MKIPKSHPRYISLKTREKIVEGVTKGITSQHGLIAHGRGEAFDYLLKEVTHDFAKEAIRVSAALLLLAKNSIISVNGNAAALVGKELVSLSRLLNCPLEVNIFHSSKSREQMIRNFLLKLGAQIVFLPEKNTKIKYLDSNRKYVHRNGIYKSDVVFVPLEDGDRCQALVKNGKKVITIDLNPMSRTSQTATITIVDNIIRTMPLIIITIKKLQNRPKKELQKIVGNFNNKKNLCIALQTTVNDLKLQKWYNT